MLSFRFVRRAIYIWLVLAIGAQAQTVYLSDDGAGEAVAPLRLYPEWHSTDFRYAETPHFTFTMDVPVLTRTNAGPQVFVRDGNGAALLDAGDIRLTTEGALKLDLILYDESGWELEFGYLGTEDFSARVIRSDPDIVPEFFGGIPANPAERYVIDYESNLHGGELNLRRRCGSHLSLLAGVRGLQLHERFDILRGGDINTGFYSKSYNHLWGLQVGGDARWWLNGVFALSATLKAGVYNNQMQVYATALDPANDSVLELYHDTSDTAFMGELTVGMLISMGHHFAIRLGYMAILFDGIALGPDQNDELSLFSDAGTVELGQPFYHGGYIGFECTW